MADRIDEAWTALRASLGARARELDAEVRSYPTPIARCDEQLTKAIADRDAAYRLVRLAAGLDDERGNRTPPDWRARLREFAAGSDPSDDEAVSEARERLVALLGR